MIGRTIAHYKILARLGEGGMGAVYQGVDTMLDRPVAIKALQPHIAGQPEVIGRFRTEAALLAKLNHPNIATLYSFIRDGDDFFMVMELVNGDTLATLMRSKLDPARAVAILGKVLSGLEHAHAQGILHRDIKPANILVTPQGGVKITDFGISRALGSERLTRDLRVVGTLEYLAPERVKGEEGDARSDLYSVGVILYELLAGRLPFARNSDFELMRAHLEEEPLPLAAVSSAPLPAALAAAVSRALAKHPEARFASAREMLDALNSAAQTSILGAEPTVAPPATRYLEAETRFVETAAPVAAARGSRLPVVRPVPKRALWFGLASVSGLALLLFVVLSTAAHRPANIPPVDSGNRPTSATVPQPVESASDAPIEHQAADPPPVAETPPGEDETAAQEKREQRARRRAAAMKALDQ